MLVVEKVLGNLNRCNCVQVQTVDKVIWRVYMWDPKVFLWVEITQQPTKGLSSDKLATEISEDPHISYLNGTVLVVRKINPLQEVL